jgi:hypothetical protein
MIRSPPPLQNPFQIDLGRGPPSLFLFHPERALVSHRKHLAFPFHCLRLSVPRSPTFARCPIPLSDDRIAPEDAILNSLVILPVLALGDPRFAASLVLKTRIRDKHNNCAGRAKRFVAMADA